MQSQIQMIPPFEPTPDWVRLSRNDEVALHLDGEEVTSGYVDMVAMDGSVLWLIQTGGKGRAMFHHNDGLFVFRKLKTANTVMPRFYKG